ncbi:MAG TPA: sigma 54-interacting transcriptional regulator [Planctomycetota bacterium]|nr:sigma 54-interacting transcriptional regulator [Planctomycetota bacterium]
MIQGEGEFQQIVEAIAQAVYVLSPGGKVLYANRLALDFVGLGLKDVQADDIEKRVWHPGDFELVRAEHDRGFAAGVPFELELRARGKDGQYRWFLARFNPTRDERGQVFRWYATATDIDDRKKAEERLRDDKEKLRRENIALREEVDKASMFEEIVGASAPLKAVLARVAKVAPTDSTVLITGETGTGKELIARAIHRHSERSSHPFVSVNCAAISQSLIASELFGHEKGAFTGALQRRLGRFELAEGGTIFLDEVGEIPLETQVALLRVLQEREFERVGGDRLIKTNVRVIAATNRDLQSAIVTNAFRSDLYYRFNVFPIEVPPLRERKDDIRLLTEYFIDRFARKTAKTIKRIDKKTLELLLEYSWPGNIRELQNVIERSVILCDTENFSVDENWLSRAPQQELAASPVTLSKISAAREKEMIEAALAASKGRVSGPSGAATELGLSPSTLESKIRALKIDKYRFKSN